MQAHWRIERLSIGTPNFSTLWFVDGGFPIVNGDCLGTHSAGAGLWARRPAGLAVGASAEALPGCAMLKPVPQRSFPRVSPARPAYFSCLALLLLLAGCAGPQPAPAPAPGAAAKPPSKPTPAAAQLAWPAAGPLIARFDGRRNKGIDIGGTAGAPVRAAAAGQVVFAAAGPRGYGQLVMLEHTGQLVTAYAHNRKLLVTEGQRVQQGQQLAEMGSSGTDRVKLHFEVRRAGEAVDPLRYLPRR